MGSLDIFEEVESIRSINDAFPEDEAHQERIGDDFVMR